MTSTLEHTASCALCRRHLLVGEPARLYQDPSSKRFLKVCPLCYERAERRGWQADGTPIVAVHANPPRDHLLRERENLIDRLRGQLQSVEFDLDQVRSALAKAEQQSGELRTLKRENKEMAGEIRRRDRDLRQLQDAKRRAEEAVSHAEAAHRGEIKRHHDVAAQLDQRVAQLGQLESRLKLLEQELERERRRHSDLAEARRLEGDSRHIRRLALEAFNRSEHVDRVVAISRSIGDPVVHVAVDACSLPRLIRITVAWDISWYEYVVRLDLYEQTVSVEEDGRGGDPRALPPDRLHPNAVLRSDRIVLTMQAYGVGAASA
jgi:hypothetical protein